MRETLRLWGKRGVVLSRQAQRACDDSFGVRNSNTYYKETTAATQLSLVLRVCKFCSRLRAPQFGFEGLLMHAASVQALLSHFETLRAVVETYDGLFAA